MARAVYHDADIYLLDDPLAAIDAHVGKHIFKKCIVDELLLGSSSSDSKKKNSVILVTNAIQYLTDPHVSKIVVLNGGAVAEVGTYNELRSKHDSLFSSFLSVMEETGGQTNLEDNDQVSSNDEIEDDKLSEDALVTKISPRLASFLSGPSKKIENRPFVRSDKEIPSLDVIKVRSGVSKADSEPAVKPTTPLMTSELQGTCIFAIANF